MTMTQKEYEIRRWRLPTAFDYLLSSRKKLDAITEKMKLARAGFADAYTRWHGGSSKPIADITEAELRQLNRLLEFYTTQIDPLVEKYEVQRQHFETKVRNVNALFFQLYRSPGVPLDADPHTVLAAYMAKEIADGR